MSGRKRPRSSGSHAGAIRSSSPHSSSNNSRRSSPAKRSRGSEADDDPRDDSNLVLYVKNAPSSMTSDRIVNFLTIRMKKYRLIRAAHEDSPIVRCESRVSNKGNEYFILHMRTLSCRFKAMKLNGIDTLQQQPGRPGRPLWINPFPDGDPRTQNTDGDVEVQDWEETKADYEGDRKYLCIRDLPENPDRKMVLNFLNFAANLASLAAGSDEPIQSARYERSATRSGKGRKKFIIAKAIDKHTARSLLRLNGIKFLGKELKIHLKGEHPYQNTFRWEDLGVETPQVEVGEAGSPLLAKEEPTTPKDKGKEPVRGGDEGLVQLEAFESDMSISDASAKEGEPGESSKSPDEDAAGDTVQSRDLGAGEVTEQTPASDSLKDNSKGPDSGVETVNSDALAIPPKELETATSLLASADKEVSDLEEIYNMLVEDLASHPGEPLSPAAKSVAASIIGDKGDGKVSTPLEDIKALLEKARQVARDRKERVEKLQVFHSAKSLTHGQKSANTDDSKAILDDNDKVTQETSATSSPGVNECRHHETTESSSSPEEQVQQLLDRVFSNDQALKAAEEEISRLKAQVRDHTKKTEATEREKSVISGIADEELVKSLQTENKDLREKVQLLESTSGNSNTIDKESYQKLEELSEAKDLVIADIQNENASLRNVVRSLEEKAVANNKALEESRKKAEEFEHKQELLEQRLEKSQVALTDAQSLVSQLQDQNNTLREKGGNLLDQERKKREEYQKKYHDAVFEFSESAKHTRNLMDDLFEQKRAVTKLEDVIDEEKEKRREAESKVRKLENALQEFQDNYERDVNASQQNSLVKRES